MWDEARDIFMTLTVRGKMAVRDYFNKTTNENETYLLITTKAIEASMLKMFKEEEEEALE